MFKGGKHEFVTRYQTILEPQAGYGVSDSIKNSKPNNYYLGDLNFNQKALKKSLMDYVNQK